MITLRQERPADVEAREALLDQAFGGTRNRKTSQRLREGRLPAERLGFIAVDGRRVIGTARLWSVVCGNGQPALLLGPVAVAANSRNRGIGAALVRRALRDARRLGHGAVILVGDAPYYSRFGFAGATAAGLKLPGPLGAPPADHCPTPGIIRSMTYFGITCSCICSTLLGARDTARP